MMINAAKEELMAIQMWEFQHVRRGSNTAAHCLAKTSLCNRRDESLARNFSILYSGCAYC
jgi:hypothetical protein